MPGPILYRSRFLLPITSSPLEDGGLLVDHGMIRARGPFRELTAAHPGAIVVDFGEAVVLPPMVNAHTHLELSAFAKWAAAAGEPVAPQAFVDWILWLVRVRRNVTEEQFRESLVEGLRLSLMAGTGAIGDILTSLGSASGYRSSPLRGRVYAEVLGHDSKVVLERLAAIENIQNVAPGDALDWGLSPHTPYTLSPTAIDDVFAFAARRTLQCATHLAESVEEVCFLQDGSGAIAEKLYPRANWDLPGDAVPGCSPVKTLCRQGRLQPGDLVIHGVQAGAADVALLKASGCSLVLCPRSNATLNVGKTPVAAYLEAGVPLALGTDSLASSSSLSLWDEVAFARSWFAAAVAPRDWLKMATLGGSQALGLQDRLGQLAPGCEASFQVVTLTAMPGIEQLEEALCSAGQAVKVTHLFLAARNVLP